MNATQLEFQAKAGGHSQADKILARLTASTGEWVEMPELVRVSGGYAVHSRIADLRKRGEGKFQIDHRNENVEGKIHSFYKLEFIAQP